MRKLAIAESIIFNKKIFSKSAEHPYLWEHSHRRLHVVFRLENYWCEALFEKNGCRKFALILEKPKTGQNGAKHSLKKLGIEILP